MALLRIDPPFEERDTIKPIQINEQYQNLKGRDVLMSGWGMTTHSENPSPLYAIFMKITNQTYQKEYGWVIEMKSYKGEGACYGDSGGNNMV